MDDSAEKFQESVNELVLKAKAGGGSELMNACISDLEVKHTFGKGSETPGPDEFSSKFIDEANRELMHMCLKMLWNKAWSDGCFIAAWKDENRVVIPKLNKESYNECNSYRTVSITPCLGKRCE